MCNRAVCHKSQSASLLSKLIMYFTTRPAPSSSAFGFWPFWRTFEAKPKSSSWHPHKDEKKMETQKTNEETRLMFTLQYSLERYQAMGNGPKCQEIQRELNALKRGTKNAWTLEGVFYKLRVENVSTFLWTFLLPWVFRTPLERCWERGTLRRVVTLSVL